MATLDFSDHNLFDPITTNINGWAHRLPNALLTLLAGFIVIRLISMIASWIIGFIRMPKGLKGIIISLLDTLLTVFLVIVTLQSLGLNNLALVFSAMVAATGIAIGNGSVTLISDIIAGVALARDNDFSVGDIVRAGEEKTEGEIVSMDMRRTRIRSKTGRLHSIPNSVIERKEYVLVAKKRDRTDI